MRPSIKYVTKICKVCSKSFSRIPSWFTKKKVTGNCCSYKCSGKYKSGKHHYNWTGGLPNCIDCGKQIKLYTAKRCKRCWHKYQSITYRGTRHWLWKKGISPETNLLRNSKQGTFWKLKIFERDHFTCQKCNKQKYGHLIAHHLEGFHWCISLRFEVSNGITLCKKCHDKFHWKFGTNWNTTKQFVKFLGYKI